jgi:NAD(P)-dependent dehydrogenase (short-subunit alcohol dehydrogenase family)
MQTLKGKVAVVTGASRGAGKGIALELGEAGATVYVTGRSITGYPTSEELPHLTIDETAREVTARGGQGVAIGCDHNKDEDVKAVFARVKEEQGKLDILVNNVWSGYENMEKFSSFFWEQPLWRWDSMFSSIRAHFAASQHAVPLMMASDRGLIVGTTFWDDDKFHGNVPYYMSKMNVKLMAYGMAENLRDSNIASIALSLGWIRTEKLKMECNIDDYNYKEFMKFKKTESTHYAGRAIISLYHDINVMTKSGGIYTTGALASEYGFTDLDGSQPLPYRRGQH